MKGARSRCFCLADDRPHGWLDALLCFVCLRLFVFFLMFSFIFVACLPFFFLAGVYLSLNMRITSVLFYLCYEMKPAKVVAVYPFFSILWVIFFFSSSHWGFIIIPYVRHMTSEWLNTLERTQFRKLHSCKWQRHFREIYSWSNDYDWTIFSTFKIATRTRSHFYHIRSSKQIVFAVLFFLH